MLRRPWRFARPPPGKPAEGSSFTGLHESFVNVRGVNSVIAAIRKVWSYLLSDAALLYRKEVSLDAETSAMAVFIQEILLGERSGVVFCRNPDDPDHAVVESVHELNEALVVGRVEPDRWILDQGEGRILSHTVPAREEAVAAAPDATTLLRTGDRTTLDGYLGIVTVDREKVGPSPASSNPPKHDR